MYRLMRMVIFVDRFGTKEIVRVGSIDQHWRKQYRNAIKYYEALDYLGRK